VDIDNGRATAKFWLDHVTLVRSHGFAPKELNELFRIVGQEREKLIEAWNEYFSSHR
jgi:hypothetical protein